MKFNLMADNQTDNPAHSSLASSLAFTFELWELPSLVSCDHETGFFSPQGFKRILNINVWTGHISAIKQRFHGEIPTCKILTDKYCEWSFQSLK